MDLRDLSLFVIEEEGRWMGVVFVVVDLTGEDGVDGEEEEEVVLVIVVPPAMIFMLLRHDTR